MYANFGIVHNDLIFSALLFMFISIIIPYVSVNYNVSKNKKKII